MKRTALPASLVILIFALNLTACDDFFSSGWGTPREYSAGNINVTINNLDRWLDRTIGNPPLAKLVSENISKQVADPHHPHRAQFQRAGVRMAVESSGLGVALSTNALAVLSDMADADDEDMEEMLKDILSGIQRDFRNSGGAAAAANITTIAANDIPGNPPTFPPESFAHQSTPSEVGQVILVLTLAVMDEKDVVIDEWDFDDLYRIGLDYTNGVFSITGASDTVRVLAAYLNLITKENGDSRFDDNFLTAAIRDAFSGN